VNFYFIIINRLSYCGLWELEKTCVQFKVCLVQLASLYFYENKHEVDVPADYSLLIKLCRDPCH